MAMNHAVITWYGHSCFQIDLSGYSIVLDPYALGYVPGLRLPELKADAAFASHQHSDHNALGFVNLTGRPLGISVRMVNSVHDHHDGTRRGENRITVIEGEGLRIVHLGDQGRMLTQEEIEKIGQPDLLMIPVGGHYTIGADEAHQIMDALHPSVTVPMHYRDGQIGYDVLATLDEFVKGKLPVVYPSEPTFTLTKGMTRQILVPRMVQGY